MNYFAQRCQQILELAIKWAPLETKAILEVGLLLRAYHRLEKKIVTILTVYGAYTTHISKDTVILSFSIPFIGRITSVRLARLVRVWSTTALSLWPPPSSAATPPSMQDQSTYQYVETSLSTNWF